MPKCSFFSKIEPGLLEWLGWYPDGVPLFMTGEELVTAGYNIDLTYRPVIPVSRLPNEETCEQHYERNARTTAAILANTKLKGFRLCTITIHET